MINNGESKKRMGLYIHLPFCVRKCNYCDFVSGIYDDGVKKEYVRALLKEIGSLDRKYDTDLSDTEIETVYFGGGTPGSINASFIENIMNTVRDNLRVRDDAEISIEINPGIVDDEKLRIYKANGINRISIGLQSANDDELKLLGRIHTYRDFEECYDMVRNRGFDNVSVDIITALPDQSMEMLDNTLDRLTRKDPEHISAYSLIIEEGTPFYKLYGEGGSKREMLLCEDEERRMYYHTERLLSEYGYERYEISNFAKPGYRSRHNISYWKRIPYIGAGLCAAGLINEVRYKNTDDMGKYIAHSDDLLSIDERIVINREEQMDETVFLGLRMTDGVDIGNFSDRFGVSLKERYKKEIDKLCDQELITIDERILKLTSKGIDYGNYVFSCFYNI